jgi:cold shock CspA family protein
MSERLTGGVVFCAPEKRFGFLRADNAERDCFFHINNYRGQQCLERATG